MKFFEFLFLLSLIFGITDAMECKRKFNLNTHNNLSSLEILESLAQNCQLNLIYLDSFAKDILTHNKPQLSIKNLDAQTFLDLLLDEAHLHYQLQNNILKISFLYTKTYELIISPPQG